MNKNVQYLIHIPFTFRTAATCTHGQLVAKKEESVERLPPHTPCAPYSLVIINLTRRPTDEPNIVDVNRTTVRCGDYFDNKKCL